MLTRVFLAGLTACLTCAAAGAADVAPMPAVSADFSIESTPLELAPRCASEFVAGRLIAMLDAYNSGRAHTFALFFRKHAQLHPYAGLTGAQVGVRGSTRAGGVVGRTLIERFVSVRHQLGDGWTITRLLPPLGTDAPAEMTVYGASLRMRRGTNPLKPDGVKIVVNCSSGAVMTWIGPGP